MSGGTLINERQKLQEDQYHFPYHHVAKFRNGFQSTYYVKYGLKQITSLEFILTQLKQLNFNTLCDLGCGDGRLAQEVHIEFPEVEITGIDYSERAIHLAKGFCPDLGFIQKNILEEKIQRTFDVVTLIEVFEHIPIADCQRFVKATATLLEKGGKLMVTVPHTNLPLSSKHEQHFDLQRLKSYFNDEFLVIEEKFLEKRGGWRLYCYYRLMKNKLFLLNHKGLLKRIYHGYKKHLLIAESEQNCERLYLLLEKK